MGDSFRHFGRIELRCSCAHTRILHLRICLCVCAWKLNGKAHGIHGEPRSSVSSIIFSDFFCVRMSVCNARYSRLQQTQQFHKTNWEKKKFLLEMNRKSKIADNGNTWGKYIKRPFMFIVRLHASVHILSFAFLSINASLMLILILKVLFNLPMFQPFP